MNRKAKHYGVVLAICAVCTGVVAWLAVLDFKLLVDAEFYAQDWLMRQGRKTAFNDQLVLVGIDRSQYDSYFKDSELQADPVLRAIAQPYPWSRDVWATVITKLAEAGAKTIVIDLVFAAPKNGDDELRRVLDRYRDRVVIGYAVDLSHTDRGNVFSLTLPNATLIDPPPGQQVVEDDRLGYVAIWPEADNVLRRAHFRHTGSELSDVLPAEVTAESLAARALRKFGHPELIPAGTEPRRFRYTGPAKMWRAISLGDVLGPATWTHNFTNGAYFKDKLVLIGPTASLFQDSHTTPFGEMPGPEIHLNLINAALQGEFVRSFSLTWQLVAIGFACVLAAATSFLFRNPLKRLTEMIMVCGGYGALAYFSFDQRDCRLLTIAAPVFVFVGSSVGILAYDFFLERREKQRTRKTLERYVSKKVARELLDNPESFLNTQNGVRKPVTVLFSDVRGFTTLTEGADSAQLVKQLNEYFPEMVGLVFAHDGSLDKFIGDAVMAVWGNLTSLGAAADARQAVATALAMHKSLAKLNSDWRTRGMPELHIGIGLNHGEAIVGNLGSAEKMELTVIGDAVNLASRLESLTKEYHLDLLLGESVAPLVGDAYPLRLVDSVRVKGKLKPVDVYTVVGETGSSPDWLTRYEQGVQRYRRREFTEAVPLFEQVLQQQPGDHLSQMYLERCREYLAHPPAADWDGVHVMTKK